MRIPLIALTLSLLLVPSAWGQQAPDAGPCDGWTTRVVAEGLGSLENLEPDGEGGMLISATTRNAVERLLPDGSVAGTVAADLPAPGGLRVRDGVLFANTGDSAADGALGRTNGTIERIDLGSGERTTYTSGLTMPNGLVFDSAGNAYTSRDVGMPSYIAKVPADDPANPDVEWADLPDTNGLAIDPAGQLLYVATTFNAPASVYAVRLDDPSDITEIAQLQGVGSSNPAKGLDDMTIDGDGVLYITANGSGELLRLDPDTAEACQITDALVNPSAVKFGAGPGWPAENLYVSAFDGRVVEVAPPAATGAGPGEGGGEVVVGGPLPPDFSCPARSWFAGTTELCGGVLTHRDYVFDDYGADLGTNQATSTGTLAQPAGDVRYAEGGPHNTADLVDLSLRVVDGRLDVLAELSSLFTDDSTLLVVAVDVDDDRATGGGPWPGLPGLTSDGWDQAWTFTATDTLANLIGGSVPVPPGQRWRVQAVVVDVRPDSGGRNVMNVAFRGPDEQAKFAFLGIAPPGDGAWFEDRQAAALAAGDISELGVTVDVADLQAGGRSVGSLEPVGPGLHERVYTSDVTLPPGEGMDYVSIRGRGTGGPSGAFDQEFHYFGRYQPYGVYLPDQRGPHELAMIYHGSNQNHSQQINQPGVQQQVAEAHNRLLVAPLARGVHGYGSDISERDLEDVEADARATFDLLDDRQMAAGYSQGGYVTFRQAALHPDRFSSMISWVGFTGDAANPAPNDGVTAGAVGNMFDFVGNYADIRAALVYGGSDELVHPTSSGGMAAAFADRGYDHTYYLHPTADHFTYALLDEWQKESDYVAGTTLATDPPRVTFRTAEVLGDVDAGVRHDRAHWISQIRGRETIDDHFRAEEVYIDLDLASDGCGTQTRSTSMTQGAGEAPVPWVATGVDTTEVVVGPAAPRLTGTLGNVSSAVIDVVAACLEGAFEYDLDSDGPSLLRFSDGRQLRLDAGASTGTVPLQLSQAGGGSVVRLAGEDRVSTAIAVSQTSRPSASTVVLARADDYADALGAGPLAAALEAPLLLTGSDVLDDRVRTEVGRLGAADVVLVGGVEALAADVESAVADLPGVSVRRIAGPDRFATAAAVAQALVAEGGDGASVYLVEGANADPARGWPDAVSVGALAARQGRPILLTGRAAIPAPTLEAMTALGTVEVTAVGGEAAIPWRTLAMAADPDGDGVGQAALNRIAGADRYQTSARVADRTLVDLATTEVVWLVTGSDWPDALAAGPAAAASGGVLLTVDPAATAGASSVARDWLTANRPAERLVLVGGPAALPDGVAG